MRIYTLIQVSTPSVADRVHQALGIHLQDLSGASLTGEIPLQDAFVNRLLADRLARTEGPVAAARVEARDQGRVSIELSMRGPRLMPGVTIEARIEQQPQFPQPAILGLRWSVPGIGPLALLAAPALAYFKALPPGIRVEGARILVDVGELLRQRDLGDLIGYLAGLRITTRSGIFLVQFELRIP